MVSLPECRSPQPDQPKAQQKLRIDNTAGIILAGGRSSRFGSNKALADFRGIPLIRQVSDLMDSLFPERLLITQTPEIYRFLGWPTRPDLIPGQGPLGGIHAALTAVSAPRCFIAACDMPFLNPGLISYLCAQAGEEWDVVVPCLDQGLEPLHAVYRKSALAVIEENLRGGQKKISTCFEQLRVKKVTQAEIGKIVPDLITFCNINRHEDLQDLIQPN